MFTQLVPKELSSAQTGNVRLLGLDTVRLLQMPDQVIFPRGAARTALDRARKGQASQVSLLVFLQLAALIEALAPLTPATASKSTFVGESMFLRVHAVDVSLAGPHKAG